MKKCKKCLNSINEDDKLVCNNCGATFCENCAIKTKRICPNCYSNLILNN